jgi:hypothetical protein
MKSFAERPYLYKPFIPRILVEIACPDAQSVFRIVGELRLEAA